MEKKDQLFIKFKKTDNMAFTPEYSSEGAAGLDIRCLESYYISEEDYIEYKTGIAVEIPEGYVGLLFPRSSVSKTPHMLANSVGVIDSDYRGEIRFRFRNPGVTDEHVSRKMHSFYDYGDKIGQLVIIPYPKLKLQEVDSLDDTVRGAGGYGSTGR